METLKMYDWTIVLPVYGMIFLLIFIMCYFEEKKREYYYLSPIKDSLTISFLLTINVFLFVFLTKYWLVWIIGNLFLWVMFDGIITKKSKVLEKLSESEIEDFKEQVSEILEKEKLQNEQKILLNEKEKIKKDLEHFRTKKKQVKEDKEKREKFIKDELNGLVGYIVQNKERVKNNNRYKNSVVDIFNEMYQEGLSEEKSNSQIVEEIDDFFENRLSKTLTHGMSERFRTLIEKLEDISYSDDNETEVIELYTVLYNDNERHNNQLCHHCRLC